MANKIMIGNNNITGRYSMGYKISKVYIYGVEYSFAKPVTLFDTDSNVMLDTDENVMKGKI